MSECKVSVVIPVYNVEKYLRQCLDSVINQTLKEIEIIIVNDGSKDSSLSIIKEYAAADDRIVVIDKPNGGYGESMNRGFDKATGEYIGIVESDDFIEPNMFEKLYERAKEYELDVVKSGFYLYWSTPVEKNEPYKVASSITSQRTFCPVEDFKCALEQVEFFNMKNSIWSAIYRRDFIRENAIRFNETPGASFQDTAFSLKVWCCAKRVRLMEECFLHYRQDNENSSVNSTGKVYCICDEYDEITRFLNEKPGLKGKIMPILVRVQYDAYTWNYMRLGANEEKQREFIKRFHDDFQKHDQNGLIQKKYYEWYRWNDLHFLLDDYEEFHKKCLCQRYNLVYVNSKAAKGNRCVSKAPVVAADANAGLVVRLKRKIISCVRCYKEHGFAYTWKYFMQKIKRRLSK